MTEQPRAPTATLPVAAALLGANWVAIRVSNTELAPLWGAGIRLVIASLLLLTIARIGRVTFPRERPLAGALLYGSVGYGLNTALVYWSLVHLSAGAVAVIFAALPLAQSLISSRVGHERLTASSALGALLVLLGVIAVFSDRLQAGAPASPILGAFIAMLGAAAAAAIVRSFPDTHPVATNTLGTGAGGVLLVAASLFAGETWTLPASPDARVAVAYLPFSTVALVLLLTHIIVRWSATAAAYVTVLSPLVALPLASVVLSETFSASFYVGAGVIGLGTYLGAIRGQRAHVAMPRRT